MSNAWGCLACGAAWEEHALVGVDNDLRCGDSACRGSVVPLNDSTLVLLVFEDTVLSPLYPEEEFPF